MTDATWDRMLFLFEENQRRLAGMKQAEPIPLAQWCGESPHRTLGHLTACQAAWLSLMQQLRDHNARGSVPIRPDPLFTKLGFKSVTWEALLERFNSDRAEWRSILYEIDVTRQIQTPNRVHSAQSLTKRLVNHEKSHIDDLPEGG